MAVPTRPSLDVLRLRWSSLAGRVRGRAPALAARDVLLTLRDCGVPFEYESVLEVAYRRLLHPGDVVVDVGAHTGRHAGVFAELVGLGGRVVALEPVPEVRATLEARAAAWPNVTVLPFAAADQDGTLSFVHAVGTPEESGLRQRTVYNVPEQAAPTTITVEARRLDTVLAGLDRLDYVKIDIEGGEIDCLRGATATLERFGPILSVEYGYPGYSAYGHDRDSLPRLAAELGYVAFDLFGNRLDGPGVWEQVCDAVYWDYFLVPKDRTDALRPLLR